MPVDSSPGSNEYWALEYLSRGLVWLHDIAIQCDNIATSQHNPNRDRRVILFGASHVFEGVPLDLLTCVYHWYSLTACQLVRTVGAIALQNDSSRPKPLEYVKRVIPEVLPFRDKVAAHFAWTSMNDKDSHAERQASIMPPLTFVNDAFFVGALNLRTRRSGQMSDSSSIRPWCIRDIHRRLEARYWPKPSQPEEEGDSKAQVSTHPTS